MESHPQGLSFSQANALLAKWGKNSLPHERPVSDIFLVGEQLKSPLIYILLGASVISLLLGDFKDAVVILATVFINTILGFYQERKAQRSLYLLRTLLTPQARVVREGKQQMISAELLVPGDHVLLTSGEQVAADGYVIHGTNLKINEAVLTGESVVVTKEVAGGKEPYASRMQVYMGTTVAGGRGMFVVEKTGKLTEFGKIALQLSVTHEEKTPLQIKIEKFARFLAFLIGGVAAVIFMTGIVLGQSLVEMFSTSIAIAVAAIPEGMAVSLTVILAIGMQRILKRKALVRKLLAAEALGSTTVIVTDKTGTLTEGNMSVVKVKFVDEEIACQAMILSNDREDPLEYAIWEYAEKLKLNPERVFESSKRIAELPFDSVNKLTAAMYQEKSGEVFYVKGAPEELIARTNMSHGEKTKWLKLMSEWGEEGLRIVGLAYKRVTGTQQGGRELLAHIHTLNWLGLVGIADPVRESVKESFDKAQRAGISIKVVTGDYTETSIAVLRKLGIGLGKNEVFEGAMLDKMSDEDLDQRIGQAVLFSRVTPMAKLRIVTALQRKGEIVALIGDGVNDAPALKAANIGVVVGTATDVAKQTADMVLLDSNFETIVAAIEEGRGIYRNIRKVVLYLLSGSFSEVVLVVGTLILGLPLPLTASQILWINMVADSLPNLALTVEPKDRNLLNLPPENPQTQFLDKIMRIFIFLVSVTTGVFLLVLYLVTFKASNDIEYTRTVVFMALGITSLVYVFSVRSIHQTIFSRNFFSNWWLVLAVTFGLLIQTMPLYSPVLASFLVVRVLSYSSWIQIALVPIGVILSIEVAKLILVRFKKI